MVTTGWHRLFVPRKQMISNQSSNSSHRRCFPQCLLSLRSLFIFNLLFLLSKPACFSLSFPKLYLQVSAGFGQVFKFPFNLLEFLGIFVSECVLYLRYFRL